MRVEWDPAKDIENKKKHGISFELASYVFADPNRLERFDRAESNDERRVYYGNGNKGNTDWTAADN